jgi:hypothetical protein
MADRLSRDIIRAEVEANDNRPDTLSYIATHGPDVERNWSHSAPSSTLSHDMTPAYTVGNHAFAYNLVTQLTPYRMQPNTHYILWSSTESLGHGHSTSSPSEADLPIPRDGQQQLQEPSEQASQCHQEIRLKAMSSSSTG